MQRRRDEPWHITNGRIGSAREYVNQAPLIRWFDREYVDERDETCVLGNRSHERSPATGREIVLALEFYANQDEDTYRATQKPSPDIGCHWPIAAS
jgi:hypothetical protein